MKGEPDFLQNLRDEVGGGRQWLDRAIVITYAVLAGLAVVLLTLLADAAFAAYQGLRSAAWWAPLLWTPALTALIVWATRRWAPGAAGSGVPQVLAALAPETPIGARSRFVSLRLSLAKIGAVAGGLLAGLSIGRQGPSVQMAAGVMLVPDTTVMAVNYGFERVRFVEPVPSGARVRGRFVLRSAELDGTRLRAVHAVTVEIDGRDSPALTADWIGLLFLAPKDPT